MPNEKILKKIYENGLRLKKERQSNQKEALTNKGANLKKSSDMVAFTWTPPCLPPLP